MKVEPIFKSTEQALHVSFLVTSLPATQKTVMQAIYEANVGRSGVAGTVNTRGLTQLEFRGQCAMVCAAVDSHLGMPPERHAIKAFLGHQLVKAEGVRGIAEYLEPVLDFGGMALLATAWNVFANGEQRKGLTEREICKHYNLSQSKIHRAAEKIRKTSSELRLRGSSGLDGYFKETGLVMAE